MILHERHKKILDQLFSDGIVYTAELKDKFNTSFETIRKDLQYLEKEGLLSRVHGGAVPETVLRHFRHCLFLLTF